MDPHPDFSTTDLPRRAVLPSFRLTPLDASVMEEDYAAVTSSAPILAGLFGNDWPEGLTPEDNLNDLHWHDREFTARRSFCWVVRTETGQYLGCAYLFPEPGARGRAKVFTWIRDMPNRVVLNTQLDTQLAAWLADYLPVDLTLDWRRPD